MSKVHLVENLRPPLCGPGGRAGRNRRRGYEGAQSIYQRYTESSAALAITAGPLQREHPAHLHKGEKGAAMAATNF
jgi:hypothetical protein